MKCRYCGSENDPNNIKCVYCGAFLSEIDELEAKEKEEKKDENDDNTKEESNAFIEASTFRFMAWGSIIMTTFFCLVFVFSFLKSFVGKFIIFDLLFIIFPIFMIIMVIVGQIKEGKKLYGQDFSLFGNKEDK